MHTFTSFDGLHIAYHDEGEGATVLLVHGFGVDALGQFGDFERIRPKLEKRQQMFREVFGGALPLPNPPAEEPVLRMPCAPPALVPSCPTCAASAPRTSRAKRKPTPILPWPVTSSP